MPDDPELVAELGAVEYGYDASEAILLERKDDMRKRGLASPDDAYALALTFARPVYRPDPGRSGGMRRGCGGCGGASCDVGLFYFLPCECRRISSAVHLHPDAMRRQAK
jgi:hypothetical protein